ncbi:unnamed protein product [Durusdinium trenchii]|uniref:Uncharacterized protein n=2 Tax=Durusdinium trenchii TaxID=1381693 RepID=A0ABP0P1T5_9DINO
METSQLVAVLKPDVLASVLKGLRPRALSALLRSCRMAWESFQNMGLRHFLLPMCQLLLSYVTVAVQLPVQLPLSELPDRALKAIYRCCAPPEGGDLVEAWEQLQRQVLHAGGSSASVHYLLGLKLLLHSQHAQRQSFWAPLFGSSARCALSPPGAGAGAVVLATLRVREVMEAPVVPEDSTLKPLRAVTGRLVRAKDWKVMSWMALFAEERAWGGGGVSKTFGMVLKVSAVSEPDIAVFESLLKWDYPSNARRTSGRPGWRGYTKCTTRDTWIYESCARESGDQFQTSLKQLVRLTLQVEDEDAASVVEEGMRRLFFSAMPLDLQSYLVKGRGTDARVPMDAVPLVEQALEWSKGKGKGRFGFGRSEGFGFLEGFGRESLDLFGGACSLGGIDCAGDNGGFGNFGEGFLHTGDSSSFGQPPGFGGAGDPGGFCSFGRPFGGAGDPGGRGSLGGHRFGRNSGGFGAFGSFGHQGTSS